MTTLFQMLQSLNLINTVHLKNKAVNVAYILMYGEKSTQLALSLVLKYLWNCRELAKQGR